ncbi:MAG TPA: penicillin-binding transpeptidase domain-containing protein [Bryobacteraceae bacterium]|nr:penicillin-binding transpeptidase domain-containing protein [Bryobacteraceae bacterium]
MKGFALFPLLLAGLLQIAAPAPSQIQKSSPSSAARKSAVPARKTVRRTVPLVDPTEGDIIDGDDLTIRRAAVAGLGPVSGSVVVVDPTNGRVLTMVNQKLGLTSGFIPCSTIKLVTSLAALTEHVITRDSAIFTSRYISYNLTSAIAMSNNQYFSILGTRLGFDRVTRYAQMLGLGEKAGLDIPGEQPGVIPEEPPKAGGMGLMTAFGEGFLMTPLELAALLSSIANGGTLYYLQYPRTEAEIEQFVPKVKRTLDLAPNGISDIKEGMRGAVDYGTARRANYDPTEPILGKTGTCTDFRVSSHMGWFGSFNDVGKHQLVVVVMLTGGSSRTSNGGVAAGVAGAIYRNLSEQRYFASDVRKNGLPDITTTYPCCTTVAPPKN